MFIILFTFQKIKNRTWPSWATQNIYNQLRHEIYPSRYHYDYCGAEMSKFKGGW